MITSRRAWIVLSLVLLLGGALGLVGAAWAERQGWICSHRGAFGGSQGALEWLTHELTLTAEQQKQMEVILDETEQGYRAIRERVRPEFDQVRQQGREKVRAILTEKQRAKFEELVRRLDDERARRRREHEQRSR